MGRSEKASGSGARGLMSLLFQNRLLGGGSSKGGSGKTQADWENEVLAHQYKTDISTKAHKDIAEHAYGIATKHHADVHANVPKGSRLTRASYDPKGGYTVTYGASMDSSKQQAGRAKPASPRAKKEPAVKSTTAIKPKPVGTSKPTAKATAKPKKSGGASSYNLNTPV